MREYIRPYMTSDGKPGIANVALRERGEEVQVMATPRFLTNKLGPSIGICTLRDRSSDAYTKFFLGPRPEW